MSRQDFGDLGERPLGSTVLVSTDVFDTLLLRRLRSERSRIVRGERRFARQLADRGLAIEPDHLVEARLQSQRLAFRALGMGDHGEVRLTDVIAGQFGLLGLPDSLIGNRLAIEIAVEKESLAANVMLATALRRLRQRGCLIVAVSDTTLPAVAVAELIEHFHGPGLVDRVWSSADEGRTKRRGDLFGHVAASEGVAIGQMLHVGDDELADRDVPEALGIATYRVLRNVGRARVARLGGGLSEAGRVVRRRLRAGRSHPRAGADRTTFGLDVLGPIVAEFCMLIWLYARHAANGDDAVLAFCARGGIGIRAAFEEVLHHLALPLTVPRANLMVSRLVAARAATLARSEAALQELGREFRECSFAEVAAALGGRAFALPEPWQNPFDTAQFYSLLFSYGGAEVRADMARQNSLFVRHLSEICAGRRRIILCDTGLYGSTQRLLAGGLPAETFETIQFARANYKRHSEDHFPRVVGLMVERDLYSPVEPETCVLRYWHLIESLFEPHIPSVHSFREEAGGLVGCNSGDIRYGAVDPAQGNALLTGALHYIRTLRKGDEATVLADAERAWHRLKRAITHPAAADVACLEAGQRSVDFGRSGTVDVLKADAASGFIARLASIRTQLWREGAIARQFPVLKPALLTALDSAHALRGIAAHRLR